MSFATDNELAAVAAEVKALDPLGARTARVLRDTLDQLYDGQRTGRYRWDQLFKTEKTHCGTLVEINLQREFKFQDGNTLDFHISGIEVDCKYSQRRGGWMIPPEARGQLCILLSAEDTQNPAWSMGLVRASEGFLHTRPNRDSKATLNENGRQSIVWIFKDAPLPPNVLLQLDSTTVEQLMSLKSGQRRINALFRCALGKIVRRAVIATVAQQDDYMKRVRANGGARTALKAEGIVILGQYESHTAIARSLGVPVPEHGDSISVRLALEKGPGKGIARIGSQFWRVAMPTDPIVPAPELPKI